MSNAVKRGARTGGGHSDTVQLRILRLSRGASCGLQRDT